MLHGMCVGFFLSVLSPPVCLKSGATSQRIGEGVPVSAGETALASRGSSKKKRKTQH